MMTTEVQEPLLPENIGLSPFTAVCGPDGHSQALRDGFMAAGVRGEADIGFKAEN
ncbi:hypothetical protein [Desulfolithobacter sp.]